MVVKIGWVRERGEKTKPKEIKDEAVLKEQKEGFKQRKKIMSIRMETMKKSGQTSNLNDT